MRMRDEMLLFLCISILSERANKRAHVEAHIPRNTMRYKEIARYSFFDYLYMVEIIINNTRVLLVRCWFFFFFRFISPLPLFNSVSLHCINSSRGKNNRGCSSAQMKRDRERAKISRVFQNTMKTRQNAWNTTAQWKKCSHLMQTCG